MSLKKTAISGLSWTFLERFGIQLIVFGVSLVLARVLSPAEFGLIGMLSVFMALARTLIDSGLSQSLIRSDDLDQRDFSTVFHFNLVGSIILYIIIYLSAPFIAEFYGQPLLKDIARVYCFVFVINAFSAVQLTRLTKEMDFKTQMKASIPSQLLSAIIGLVLAFNGFGVWSLVYMSVAQSLLNTIQIWWWSGWVPSLVFDKARFKKHFAFGYKLGMSALINTGFNNIYPVVIGKYFSAVDLGFYSRAARFKNLPLENLNFALNKVTYPLFASIKDNSEQLKHVYKQLMKTVIFIIAPTMLFMSALSEPVVLFFLGDKWASSIPYLQIMCFGGILSPIHSYNLNILKVKGRSDLFLRLEIIKRVILVATVLITVHYGVMGLIWGQFIDSIIFLFVNSYYSGRFINYTLKEQTFDLLPIIGLALMAALGVYVSNYFLQEAGFEPFWRLLVGGVVGFFIYLGIAHILKVEAYLYIRKTILKR